MINALRNHDGRLRNGWWILLFYLTLGALIVPATIYCSTHGGSVGIWFQAVLAALATAICLRLRGNRHTDVVGTAASWRRGTLVGLIAGSAIWLGTAGVLWATADVTWRVGVHPLEALFSGALACLSVAVTEELVFRGFPFQRMLDGLGVWPAQILMAAYFVLTHSGGLIGAGDVRAIATVNIFLAGILFGTAYLKTRSLALPIVLHFTLNFVQGSLLGFGVSGTQQESALVVQLGHSPTWWTGGTFGLEASIPGTIAIALALLVMTRWQHSKNTMVANMTPTCG
ncbi:MAG: CPBP family intramembrane glutamic endopeptidase [Luteimonas sp.]